MDARDPLQVIPGVGPRTAADLRLLGIQSVDDLRAGDPQKLYDRLVGAVGHPVDRCVLYVFRCAVYYASHDTHDGELLKWWNWKDGGTAVPDAGRRQR